MEQFQVLPVKMPKPKKLKPGPKLPVRRKLVAVGDMFSGQRALLSTFRNGFYEHNPFQYNFENHVVDTEVDGHPVEIALWRTPTMEDYERLRPLNYLDVDVVLICFGIDCPQSLDSVRNLWAAEVLHYCKDVPVILVGCKKDLRTNPRTIEELSKVDQKPVSKEEVAHLLQKLNIQAQGVAQGHGFSYYECSCVENDGVREVFQAAVRAAFLHANKRKQTSCILL